MLRKKNNRKDYLFDISSFQKKRRSNCVSTSAFSHKRKTHYIRELLAISLSLGFVIAGVRAAKAVAIPIAFDSTVSVRQALPLELERNHPLPTWPEVMLARMPPAPAPEPVAEPKPSLPQGLLLIVNKDDFTLSLYQDGSKLKSYSAGLGKQTPETETPVGKFQVIIRTVNPPLFQGEESVVIPGGDPKNPLGPRWLGLDAGINQTNSIGIHGTTEGAGVGRPQTDGCVQINNEVIRTLYDQVPLGTPVWIGATAQLADWGL